MKMMQASMIYAQESVARMIAGKMTKSHGVEYLVEKVTTGFRVAPKAAPKVVDCTEVNPARGHAAETFLPLPCAIGRVAMSRP